MLAAYQLLPHSCINLYRKELAFRDKIASYFSDRLSKQDRKKKNSSILSEIFDFVNWKLVWHVKKDRSLFLERFEHLNLAPFLTRTLFSLFLLLSLSSSLRNFDPRHESCVMSSAFSWTEFFLNGWRLSYRISLSKVTIIKVIITKVIDNFIIKLFWNFDNTSMIGRKDCIRCCFSKRKLKATKLRARKRRRYQMDEATIERWNSLRVLPRCDSAYSMHVHRPQTKYRITCWAPTLRRLHRA